MSSSKPSISIILPVLNEANTIAKTLASLQNATDIEIIVVDGGSQDETITIAKSFGVKVLFSPAGRARQMNTGAKIASSEILLFLHADTLLPLGFENLVSQALTNERSNSPPGIRFAIAGAFELKIDAQIQGLRLIEKMVNWRSRFFSLPYGDQAIFLKTSTFRDIGGFPEQPIMEDFELIRRLKKQGKIVIISHPVLTSARRWQKLGVVKTTLINQLVIIAYFLGIPPAQIANLYYTGGFRKSKIKNS